MLNKNRTHYLLPRQVFRRGTPEDSLNLLRKMLNYTASKRFSAIEGMVHSYFDELRVKDATMPIHGHVHPHGNHTHSHGTRPLPPLFNFTNEGTCACLHTLFYDALI